MDPFRCFNRHNTTDSDFYIKKVQRIYDKRQIRTVIPIILLHACSHTLVEQLCTTHGAHSPPDNSTCRTTLSHRKKSKYLSKWSMDIGFSTIWGFIYSPDLWPWCVDHWFVEFTTCVLLKRDPVQKWAPHYLDMLSRNSSTLFIIS